MMAAEREGHERNEEANGRRKEGRRATREEAIASEERRRLGKRSRGDETRLATSGQANAEKAGEQRGRERMAHCRSSASEGAGTPQV